jgi:branched-chain amino acid transport system substrate-binding protein
MDQDKEKRGLNRRSFIKVASGATVAVSGNWFLPKITLGADDEIRIGAITEMSGPASTVGVEQMKGNELAVDVWNKNGGVLGKKIKLFKEDDETKKDVGLARARRLVERKKVHFLTGICYSSITMAIQPYARAKKIIFVSQASGNDLLAAYPNCNRYFFKALFSSIGSSMLIQPVAKRVGPRWYFTADNYSYGRLTVKWAKKCIKMVRPDMKVVGEDYTNMGETNYAPFISKVIASRADALNVQQFGAGWSRVIRQARQMGYKGHIHHGFFSYADALAAGDAVLGMTATIVFLRENPLSKAFSDRFKAKYGYYSGWAGVAGYNGVDVILQAVKAAGSTDTEKVVEAMENMKFQTVISPNYFFRKQDHMSVSEGYVGEVIKHPVYKYGVKLWKKYSAKQMASFLPPVDKRCAANMKKPG